MDGRRWRTTITYRLTEDCEVDEDLPDVDGEIDEGAVKLLVDMASVQLAAEYRADNVVDPEQRDLDNVGFIDLERCVDPDTNAESWSTRITYLDRFELSETFADVDVINIERVFNLHGYALSLVEYLTIKYKDTDDDDDILEEPLRSELAWQTAKRHTCALACAALASASCT